MPFRFFNVYGPRQAAGHVYAAVIPVFIDAALRGEPLPLNGDGLQSRDFTFVDTVTWVLADAAHRKVTSDRPVNLAIGANVTLRDLIAELEGMLGRRVADRAATAAGGRRASEPVGSGAAAQPVPRRAGGAVRGGVAGHAGLVHDAAEYPAN